MRKNHAEWNVFQIEVDLLIIKLEENEQYVTSYIPHQRLRMIVEPLNNGQKREILVLSVCEKLY